MTLWPDFIRQGRLKYLITPVVVAKKGKDVFEFMEEADFEEHIKLQTKFDSVKYLKGLGSNSPQAFKKYLHESGKYQKAFVYDQDADAAIDLAFNAQRADDRKPLFADLSFTQLLLESE
jgi:DNA topoisomerase-2